MRQVLQSSEEATLERDRIQDVSSRSRKQSSVIQEEEESSVERISGRRNNGKLHSSVSSTESATPRRNDLNEEVEEQREKAMLIRMELAMESARSLQVDLGVLGLTENGVEQDLPTAGKPTDVSLVPCSSV